MVRVIRGHVLEELRRLPDECVDWVTSPPYYGFRVYPGAEAVGGVRRGARIALHPTAAAGPCVICAGRGGGNSGVNQTPTHILSTS